MNQVYSQRHPKAVFQRCRQCFGLGLQDQMQGLLDQLEELLDQQLELLG
jgi:hypothetical protein